MTGKSKKKKSPAVSGKSNKLANTATWVEPVAYARDAVSGVMTAVYGDDRGTPEALQHRGIERVDANVEGRVKSVTKALNTVRVLYNGGEINLEMLNEAEKYNRMFCRAQMHGMRAVPMDGMPRAPKGALRQVDEAEACYAARAWLHGIHYKLGGPESRMSKAMYWVVGMEIGLGGKTAKTIERYTMKANLINALEILVSIKNGQVKKRC